MMGFPTIWLLFPKRSLRSFVPEFSQKPFVSFFLQSRLGSARTYCDLDLSTSGLQEDEPVKRLDSVGCHLDLEEGCVEFR